MGKTRDRAGISVSKRKKLDPDLDSTTEPDWQGWNNIEDIVKKDRERLLAEEYPIFQDENWR